MPINLETAELRVSDLMQREVITISRNASVQELAELLQHHSISGVPVVDPHGGVVGVVSASDLVRLAAEQGETPAWCVPEEAQPGLSGYFVRGPVSSALLRRLGESGLDGRLVTDIMMPATFSIRGEATLPELARFLLAAGVHRALVLEHGKLQGIVTTTDVLRAVAGQLEQRAQSPTPLALLVP
jgi:CBS domain-containing protein